MFLVVVHGHAQLNSSAIIAIQVYYQRCYQDPVAQCYAIPRPQVPRARPNVNHVVRPRLIDAFKDWTGDYSLKLI